MQRFWRHGDAHTFESARLLALALGRGLVVAGADRQGVAAAAREERTPP
jgi:hypothetical protein